MSGRPDRDIVPFDGLEKYFESCVGLIAKYIRENYDENTPVHEFLQPAELEKVLSLECGDKGVGMDGVVEDFKKFMKYGMRTGHTRFYNQLWAGIDIAAIVSEWFLSVMNTSMYTYEVAPVFTLMEMYCIDRFLKMIGFKEGEGTFAPGGSHANFLAILAARHDRFPEIKGEGLWNLKKPFVAFTSAHAHYTIKRTVSVIGAGIVNCVHVEVDEQGHMRPDKLDEAIQKVIADGKQPWLVSATCGTTVYGAYDDVNAICAVAKKYDMWFHVDACWGGHCLFSKNHRELMNGVEKADSVSITATKCFGLPQQCAAVLLRQRGQLRACNAMGADYLFHDYEEKNFDVGDLTLNCGRRVDSFKLWTAWKGMEARVDHAHDIAKYVCEYIKNSDGVFELVHAPEALNVCFWYVPKKYRGKPQSEWDPKVMASLTEEIRRQLQVEGKVLTNYADVPGKPYFFRHICCNPGANADDQDYLLGELKRIGDSLSE